MKKIFISHALKDKEIVSLFVDKILVLGSGVSLEDIVFTSREDTGVINGEDIPEAIKSGLKESALFFMMVSEAYKDSEVCLNEMGAAWVMDDLSRKIILLPNTGFEKIGWLMSLKKGMKLDDRDGLDMIHDDVVSALGKTVKTVTWNRYKEEFQDGLVELMQQNDKKESSPRQKDTAADEIVDYDLQDMKERFDSHVLTYTGVVKMLSSATENYSKKINAITMRLNRINGNSRVYSDREIRGLLQRSASETNLLAGVYEANSPMMRDQFDLAMGFAIDIQKRETDPIQKKVNRESGKRLIEEMMSVRDQAIIFRDEMDSVVNLDKSLTEATKRLKKALDGLLDTMSFSVTRAVEFWMA